MKTTKTQSASPAWRHDVTFKFPSNRGYDLGINAPIVFTVEVQGQKFGELTVAKGRIVWHPRHQVRGFRLTWEQLDEAILKHKKGKRTAPRRK